MSMVVGRAAIFVDSVASDCIDSKQEECCHNDPSKLSLRWANCRSRLFARNCSRLHLVRSLIGTFGNVSSVLRGAVDRQTETVR